MSTPTPSHLDAAQVLPVVLDESNLALRTTNAALSASFDASNNAIKVESITGVLVPVQYDEISLTYVPSGPGAGQIQTVTYKLAAVVKATLTLSYDGFNRLIDVLKS
jgi:hypothetical protein